MAGDWIPMRVDLGDDPDVIAIANVAKISIDEALGKLHRMWSWFDQHTSDGRADGATKEWLDGHVRCDGFSQAVDSRGWLQIDSTGLTMPNFDSFLGSSGKKRLQNSRRQKNLRARRNAESNANSNADDYIYSNAPSATPSVTESATTEQNSTVYRAPPSSTPPGAHTDAFQKLASTWRKVEEELLSLGVAKATDAVNQAASNGCTPPDVRAVIEHFVMMRPAWNAGALFKRIEALRPDQDPTTLWPAESDEYRQLQQQSAEQKRQQKAAEERRRIEQQREAEEQRLADLEATYGEALDWLDADGVIDLIKQAFPTGSEFNIKQYRRSGLTPGLRICLMEHLASSD